MKKLYLYCNVSQAYAALTYNDFLCKQIGGTLTQAPTVSYISDNYIFLSGEKLSERCRMYGVSDDDNQYPVTFEISVSEDIAIYGRFLSCDECGHYRISEDLLPLSDYNKVEDCLGVFVYGQIPVSMISRIIFENEENMQRFYKSGKELWFPEELYSLWSDEVFYNMPLRSISTSQLRECATSLDEHAEGEEGNAVRRILERRMHGKAAAYFAIDASKKWNGKNVVSNLDGALLRFLDDEAGTFFAVAQDKISVLADMFSFVDRNEFAQTDDALEDACSQNNMLLNSIFDAIAEHGYKIDKEVVAKIGEYVDQHVVSENMFEQTSVSTQMDEIKRFTASRLGDVRLMLEKTKDNDLMYALALAVKNKGRVELLHQETAEMSDRARRYAYIISGFTSGMASVPGEIKCNRPLEKRISNKIAFSTFDTANSLYIPKLIRPEDCGIVLDCRISVNGDVFKGCIETATEENAQALYEREFNEIIAFEDVSTFKNPIKVNLDGKEYLLSSITEADRFKKEIDKKVSRRKMEFCKELFIEKILGEFKRQLVEVYERYTGSGL